GDVKEDSAAAAAAAGDEKKEDGGAAAAESGESGDKPDGKGKASSAITGKSSASKEKESSSGGGKKATGGTVATSGKGGKGAGRGSKKAPPVFLFFSVYQSAQFCGAAQLCGPLDHQGKKVKGRSHDRWRSHFPVKWVFAKDLPNQQLKHITLPNNKPVAAAKDSQEVPFEQGLQMLKAFHEHKHVTSIVDDYAFYENRALQHQHRPKHQHQQHGNNHPANQYGNPYATHFT
ncbi:unnamed protein product, partial [Ectocarpus sp. 12 AP-2014]